MDMMDVTERPERKRNELVRYSAIPPQHVPLQVHEKVKAMWKGNDYQGARFPAEVVGINEEDDTYRIVFKDADSVANGDKDDDCPAVFTEDLCGFSRDCNVD